MRQIALVLVLAVVMMTCTSCYLAYSTVEESRIDVSSMKSEIYTEDDLYDAVECAKNYFKHHFRGCTLLNIGYAGDEIISGYAEFAERNGADEVIVLVCEFDVGPEGSDGSLNPNSTYTGWKWILVRTHGGAWRHVDHGY